MNTKLEPTVKKENPPAGARLEVTVIIDPDQWAEMVAQGMSDTDIEKAVIKSITLTEYARRKPVFDIESVSLRKYIG